MTERNPNISQSREVLGGTPVFKGTRVPIQTLIDYLEAGDSVSDFLEDFPTVSKEQVISVLDQCKKILMKSDEAAA